MNENKNTKKYKRGRKCCIIGCTNVNKSGETPYYHFPTPLVPWKNWKRQQWIDAVIKYNKQEDWEPTKNTVICGSHFAGGKKSEHPQHPAFKPTIFPGQCSKNKEKQVARFERRMKRQQLKSDLVQVPIKRTKSITGDSTEILAKPVTIETKAISSSTKNEEEVQAVNIQPIFVKVEDMQIDNEECRFHDFQCQTNMPNTKSVDSTLPDCIICNMIVKDKFNCAETQINLKSSNPADKIQKISQLRPVEFNGISSINYDSGLEEISGVNFATFNQILKKLPVMERLTISNANRLLIFLMKLKQGLSTSVLSILFHLTPCTIDRIINETLKQLKLSLKFHIFWPKDRKTASNGLPYLFKRVYTNFRAIIDCLEIHIEEPTNIQERIEFYTKYKSGLSFKIFFAFGPNGFITYRSKCYSTHKYGSLLADNEISKKFCELIGDKDIILAAKEFPNLKTAIENKNAIFVTPPFMESCVEEFSIHASVLNCINQIKLFKILSYMPADLVSKIDDVVQVCCALNNLRLPLKKS